ncbi:MAG TPA: hypothetical protein VH188_01420 [Chthoniobacterales bacterium]|jgi:hypothetical protein|nr:hypothetical protein [Chthoniobacterales bacterium]
MEQDWNWSANWVPSVNNGVLIPAVGQLNIASAYTVSFQLTQIWVTADLPNYNTNLLAALATINQVDTAIINAGGVETPAQAAQLTVTFGAAATILQNNLGEMNSALQKIAGFLNWQQQFIGYIQAQATSVQTAITTAATNAENNLIGDIACGDGDVRNSFNGMFADVAAKFAAMQTPFNAVNSNFQVALNAGALVAGVFLPLQGDSQLVSEYLASAQSYAPTNPLRQLKLNMAGSLWAEFVSDANTQLGTSS